MKYPEQVYTIALTQVPLIGNVLARALCEKFENAEAIFKASKKQLCTVDGISDIKAESIKAFTDFSEAETAWQLVQKHGIDLLHLKDPRYPRRLLNCYDPPTVLYYKGSANLNASRVISIVGTRHNTDYGRQFIEILIEELATHQVLVLSGMAFGTDTLAHRTCLRFQVPTVAVLAHGMHTLYPPENAKMARQMLEQAGGLITEFAWGIKPDRHNFPTRNRVVAGMSDAVVVTETDVKGGSMITAELAIGYNRDVFALPGKITEPKSRGCHELMRRHKAGLITSAADLLEAMNWLPQVPKKQVQRSLFIDLTPNEKIITDLLQAHEQLQIDELNFKSGLNASATAGALLSLELQGVIVTLPGKVYRLA